MQRMPRETFSKKIFFLHSIRKHYIQIMTYKVRYFLQKVDIIEETEYDEIIQCDHSYDSR